MSKVKNELEELSFKYLEPKAYEGLRAKVEAKRKAAEGVIDELTRTISAKLERRRSRSSSSTAGSSACTAFTSS